MKDDAIHLVQGSHRAGTLTQAGLRVVWTPDNLTYGPVSVKHAMHSKWRRRFWKTGAFNALASAPGLAQLADDAILDASQLLAAIRRWRSDVAICLWISQEWRDLLFAAWVAHALAPHPSHLRRTWIVTIPTNDLGFAVLTDDIVRDCIRNAALCSPLRVRELVEFWRKFAYRSPKLLEQDRQCGNMLPPWSPRTLLGYARLIPRVSVATPSRVGLCEVDQALFSGLSTTEWKERADLLRTPSASSLRDLIHLYGDFLLSLRLGAWSRAVPHPSVEARSEIAPSRPFPVVRYRLTSFGQSISESGLDDPRSAPGLWVGGYEAYRSSDLWVCETKTDSWRMVRYRAERKRQS